MNMRKTSHLKKLLSVGLLSPYLGSETSVWLAIRVISAIAPSKIPHADDELKLFGEMINLIALQPLNRQLQIAYALAVWPHAVFLNNDTCYIQARLFPDEISVQGYQFTSFKSFKDVIRGCLSSDFFKPILSGHPVFSITMPRIEIPVASMMMCFMPNLAQLLEPSGWFIGALLKNSNNGEETNLEKIVLTMVSIANTSYRPHD